MRSTRRGCFATRQRWPPRQKVEVVKAAEGDVISQRSAIVDGLKESITSDPAPKVSSDEVSEFLLTTRLGTLASRPRRKRSSCRAVSVPAPTPSSDSRHSETVRGETVRVRSELCCFAGMHQSHECLVRCVLNTSGVQVNRTGSCVSLVKRLTWHQLESLDWAKAWPVRVQ